MKHSQPTRALSTSRKTVTALQNEPSADVLIIGGGVNGIAVFRELALQGVDVALIERDDFASGASSASSHMVHGGIRYLENGEFRLVKEAVQERNRLLRNAPHQVRPLLTTIPVYRTFSGLVQAPARFLFSHGRGKQNERGALLIKIGLCLYDLFSRGGGQIPRHRFLKRKKALRELPLLNPRIKYTASYYDASMLHPERIVLDLLADGMSRSNARAANYVEAIGFADGSTILKDQASGKTFSFTSRVVINASGSWVDRTNDSLGSTTRFMGGTKGSHIVLDHPELLAATGGREIFFEHSDGRIVLIHPLDDRVLIGTTDIAADPNEPAVCTDEEMDYFFDLIAQVFPGIHADHSHTVYTFSGIRPLPREENTAHAFVSRDYRIERARLGDVPILNLVGGKWTTFRALGERLGGEAIKLLSRERSVRTATLPIRGGAGYPSTPESLRAWIDRHRFLQEDPIIQLMLERYGTYAEEILHALPKHPRPLTCAPEYYSEELAYLARTEYVIRLEDLLLRRTKIAFKGRLTAAGLQEIAEAVASALGWDDQRRVAEITAFTEVLFERHRVRLERVGTAKGVERLV